jgi:nitric oxide dioxygenase
MISAASRPYIDASVPVLREHGVAITTAFYRNIFSELPELTQLFNMGSQANGAQQQSLASAVIAYAANINDPGALGPLVSRIVHKHVSVGIRAEHYPIVGRHLLGAIAEVLGPAATPELLAAWDEAYNALARIFIAAERELYAGAGIAPGQLRAMRVTEVTQQGDEVIAIRMVPDDGGAVPAFRPGQYLSVTVELGEGQKQIRQYSLSDAWDGKSMRISVKRETSNGWVPAGAVSNWIHANVKSGTVLQVSPPFGDFLPDTESAEPLVFLSAGVGITPMVAALRRIAKVNRQRYVLFAHATRNAGKHAHRADVEALQAVMPNLCVVNFYEDEQGRMDIGKLPHWSRGEANVYLCGPLAFMQQQWRALVAAGAPVARLHREVFGPEQLDHIL